MNIVKILSSNESHINYPQRCLIKRSNIAQHIDTTNTKAAKTPTIKAQRQKTTSRPATRFDYFNFPSVRLPSHYDGGEHKSALRDAISERAPRNAHALTMRARRYYVVCGDACDPGHTSYPQISQETMQLLLVVVIIDRDLGFVAVFMLGGQLDVIGLIVIIVYDF